MPHPLLTSLFDHGRPLSSFVLRQSHGIQATANPAVDQGLNGLELVGFLNAIQFFLDGPFQAGAEGVGRVFPPMKNGPGSIQGHRVEGRHA
jgi:hypothetical protein